MGLNCGLVMIGEPVSCAVMSFCQPLIPCDVCRRSLTVPNNLANEHADLYEREEVHYEWYPPGIAGTQHT